MRMTYMVDRETFIEDAVTAGFTQEQAEFMWNFLGYHIRSAKDREYPWGW